MLVVVAPVVELVVVVKVVVLFGLVSLEKVVGSPLAPL